LLVSPAHTIEELRRRGLWGDAKITDLFFRNVARHPDWTALVDAPNRRSFTDGEPRRLTYRELALQTNLLSHELLSLGLEKDDILVVQLPNIAELVVTYLAAWQIGAIVSPVAIQFREHELGHIVKLLRPRAFVTCSNFKGADLARLAAACRGDLGYDILVWGDRVDGDHSSLDRAMQRTAAEDGAARAALEAHLQRAPVSADDAATICWTSGTEGVPKGVPRSHNHWIAIGHGTHDAIAVQPGEVLLNPFPMYNMASIGGLFLSWVQAAGRLVLHHPLDLEVFLGQIAEENVQHTVAPPALLNMILQDEKLRSAVSFESLRTISSGSAPLSPGMVRGFAREFGIDIVNIFGSNEGMALISGPGDVEDPELRASLFPRFGRPDFAWKNRVSAHIETQLRDLQTGEEILEPGRAGEMLIRGATVFSGYFGSDDLNEEAFTEDGFFRSGDLFEIAGPGDEIRFYKFVGRCKQLVIRGGMNISSEELDAVIGGHPKLAEAAVVGYPDETMGERVCAVVVPQLGQSVTLEEINHYLKEQGVAVYKFPERLRVVGSLPRNPMNKIERHELRKLATADEPAIV
jgi:acyl-CoA synthetase (AMP-forming)/AMP-acid ligase II